MGEKNYKDGLEDGLQTRWYLNGKKAVEANYKNGESHGLTVGGNENGQKRAELNFKDGKQISKKWWNSKGEPVDSHKEAY